MATSIDLARPEMTDTHLQMRRACHDLNAPLRAVHGFADILNRREADNLSDKGAVYLARMVAATVHMEQVVAGLHAYARIASHPLQPSPVAVGHVVQRLAAAHFQTESDSGLLQWQGDAELEWPSDATLLPQIVEALVRNSLCFVAKGSAPKVMVRWQQQGDRLQLCVSDHGIGMDAEYHQQVFDLFTRLHGRDDYPGAGTGLALVAQAVRAMAGTLTLDSASGQGCTVQILLPRLSA